MAYISYYGKVIDVPEEALVIWSLGTMVSLLELVGTLHWSQYFAMPGRANGEMLHMIEMGIQQLHENKPVIDNVHILNAINLTIPALDSFANSANEIREWQENNVPKKMKSAHNKVVRQWGPRIPPWHNKEEFRIKLNNSSEAFLQYLNALSETIQLIREVFPPDAPASWSEQIDRAIKQIPEYRVILEVGYEEFYRMETLEKGYLPSA